MKALLNISLHIPMLSMHAQIEHKNMNDYSGLTWSNLLFVCFHLYSVEIALVLTSISIFFDRKGLATPLTTDTIYTHTRPRKLTSALPKYSICTI